MRDVEPIERDTPARDRWRLSVAPSVAMFVTTGCLPREAPLSEGETLEIKADTKVYDATTHTSPCGEVAETTVTAEAEKYWTDYRVDDRLRWYKLSATDIIPLKDGHDCLFEI